MDKKGMTVSLTIIITIVVLLLIAMILVTLVNTNVLNFSGSSSSSIDSTSIGIECQTELAVRCATLKSGDVCYECDEEKCPPNTKCP